MSQVINVEQLVVSLDNNIILNDVNFSLAQGEILGLVGPSGCGKTTLLNTLAGFIEQQSGSITLAEQSEITCENMLAPEKRHVGMIFQDYALFPHLTVGENMCFGIQKQSKADKQKKLTELLALLKLEQLADRYPHQLSGGQQQRVAIARALAPEPQLLLLDEPFSNIDARLRHELILEIRQLLKSLNISAIIVTHNKDEVFSFADIMAVMSKGQFVQVGPPAELCQQPKSKVVADFLQLGSFIPCQKVAQGMTTYLGLIETQVNLQDNDRATLLIKPNQLAINSDQAANMTVAHIGVTEQGFHYLLKCLDENSPLAFEQISFYSEQVLSVGENVAMTLLPHQPIVFKD